GVMEPDLDGDGIVQTFLGESEEGLAAMEDALVALEARPDDDELLGAMFRVAHTLKGNAASLGYEALVRFCHTLEDLLERLCDRTATVGPELVGLLLRAVDALRALVPAAAAGRDVLTRAEEEVLRQLARRAAVARRRVPRGGPCLPIPGRAETAAAAAAG